MSESNPISVVNRQGTVRFAIACIITSLALMSIYHHCIIITC